MVLIVKNFNIIKIIIIEILVPDLIVVDVTENEKIILDGKLKEKTITASGKISIRNPSFKSRLWQLNCDLKETVNTSINSREISVDTLNPGQEYYLDYEISNLRGSSLKIDEYFDTSRSFPQKSNGFRYHKDNQCIFQLTLKNPLGIPISNIKLQQEIPEFLHKIKINEPNLGNGAILEEVGKKMLVWDIVTLESQQQATFEILCDALLGEYSQKSLGELRITYLINNYKLTLFDPEITGLTDSLIRINNAEGSELNMWDCSIEFVNVSEFQVRLENVKIKNKGSETVISQTPNRLLKPNEKWDYKFQLTLKDVPQLSSKIEFTPLFVLITRVRGEIIKESTILQV
jgi:hypothetical protein